MRLCFLHHIGFAPYWILHYRFCLQPYRLVAWIYAYRLVAGVYVRHVMPCGVLDKRRAVEMTSYINKTNERISNHQLEPVVCCGFLLAVPWIAIPGSAALRMAYIPATSCLSTVDVSFDDLTLMQHGRPANCQRSSPPSRLVVTSACEYTMPQDIDAQDPNAQNVS